jgi:phage/plasmid-associated DNA primase
VSKREDPRYRSGRSPDWIKSKNPDAPAVKREAEEDWAPPESVRAATDDYPADPDSFQQWLDECTRDTGPLALTRLADLFASWKQWCENANIKPRTSTALSDALRQRGFEKTREGHTGKTAFRRLTVNSYEASGEDG